MSKKAAPAPKEQNALFHDVGSDFEETPQTAPSPPPQPARQKLHIRIHPFDTERNMRFGSVKKTEAECDAYIVKLRGWLLKDETIVIEDETGLVLFLWYRQGSGKLRTWVKETMT